MSMLSDALGSLSGASGMASAAGGVNFDPYNVTSPLGQASFDKKRGTAEITASEPVAEGMEGLFSGAEQLVDQGVSTAQKDFADLRDDELSLLRELERPQEENAAAATASRLFNQGALGSTGGAEMMSSLAQKQELADLERQREAIDLARQQQQQGLQTAQLGSGLFGQATSMGQAPMGTAQFGSDLGSQELQASSQRSQLESAAAQQQGNFMSNLIGSGASIGAAALMGCSREFKTNKRSPYAYLNSIKELPVEVWDYKEGIEDESTHLGPYAEDFQVQFNLGDGKTIPVIDAIGVLFMGQKELIHRMEALENGN